MSRCEVVPSVLAPNQNVAVVVEGAGIASGAASLDLTALGGEVETLIFELAPDGTGGIATGLQLDSGLDFSAAAEVELTVNLFDSSNDVWTETKPVSLALAPVLPDDLVTEITPLQWEPGTTFTVMAMSSQIAEGEVTVDFRPAEDSTLQLPLSFSDGRAMVSGQVPSEAMVPLETSINVLIDLDDLAGNRFRVVQEALISNAILEAMPLVDGVSVAPNPIQAGEPFTVTVTGANAGSGVVMADFRPHVRSILRLPLADFTGDSVSVTAIAPANLPGDLEDFAALTVLFFSESGEQSASLVQLVPLSSIPPALDLSVGVDEPQLGDIVASESVLVSGSVGADVTSVEVNGVATTFGEGVFSATTPIREGRNDISVVSRDDNGNLNTVSVSVTRDTTAPILNIEVPSDGALVTQPQVTVAGFVNDLVTGTVNEGDVEVFINGVPADVSNRSYEVQEFVLVPGANTIEVTAIDLAGNTRSASVSVEFQDEALQQRILIASGNNQAAVNGNILADPLVVEVVNREGAVIEGVPLTFEVSRGDGLLLADGEGVSQRVIQTDDEGQAEVFYMLGSRVGEGNNRVTVTSPGFVGEVIFCASGIDGGVARVAALQPATQVGEQGRALPQPFQALVTDAGGNPISNVGVRFRVIEGDGSIGGGSEVIQFSNSSGRVSTLLTLGAELGNGAHQVIADLIDGPEAEAAVFNATARVAGMEEDTILSGVVLNAGNQPMPNVTAHIEGTTLTAFTDDEGQFEIENCPVGAIRLLVDGSTTSLEGAWPEVEFDLVTIAGQENSIDRPVYLLPLDVENQQLAGGDEDVTLSLAGVPGAELTVFANSVTGLNGEDEVTLQWTQVNLERVPMNPPLGSQFMLALTLQPAGVHFDPPARIQIPNMGAPPGQQVEMFSFDHDLGEFVAVGTATVSEDGAVLTSDPGFGLVTSGWHGCVPPPPPCEPAESERPEDTPCRRWEAIPPDDSCDFTRYRPLDANVVSLMATVNDQSSDTVFVGADVSLSAIAEAENCDGVEYEWDPGDGSGSVSGASFTHQYMEEGTFTATVRVQCTGCPTANQSESVSIEVTNEKIVEVMDSSSRMAQNNFLQIVPGGAAENVTGTAMFPPEAGEGTDPTWTLDGGNEQEGVSATYLLRAPVFTALPFLVRDASPITYEIACDDGETVTVEAYPNFEGRITVDAGDAFGNVPSEFVLLRRVIQGRANFENIINRLDPGPMGGFREFNPRVSVTNRWQECRTNNTANWTYGVDIGLADIIGGSVRFRFGPSIFIPPPFQRFVAAGWLSLIHI